MTPTAPAALRCKKCRATLGTLCPRGQGAATPTEKNMQETKPDVPQLQFVGGAVEVPFSVDVWPGVVLAGTVRPPTARR